MRRFNTVLYLFLAVVVILLTIRLLRTDEVSPPEHPKVTVIDCNKTLKPPSDEFTLAVKDHRALVRGEKKQPGRVDLAQLAQPCLDLSKKTFPFSMEKLSFARANLSGADLSGAELNGADLGHAHLEGTNLSTANLKGANLGFAQLDKANLGYAHLEGASLVSAELPHALLSNTWLAGSDLTDADLREAGLYNSHFDLSTDLQRTRLAYSEFEPQDMPDIVKMEGTDPDLRFLKFTYDRTALTKLRRAFRESGQRTQEMHVTYAIMKASEPTCVWPFKVGKSASSPRAPLEEMSSCAVYVFDKAIDATFRYGSDPLRPLIVFLAITIVCAFGYAAIIETPEKSAICRVRVREYRDSSVRLESEVKPRRIREQDPVRWFIAYLKRSWRVCNTAFFFSLMSAFNLGIKDFDLGRWIRMLSRREFDLRPKGWARTISGIQSLVALMFLALFVYSVFGHPFSE